MAKKLLMSLFVVVFTMLDCTQVYGRIGRFGPDISKAPPLSEDSVFTVPVTGTATVRMDGEKSAEIVLEVPYAWLLSLAEEARQQKEVEEILKNRSDVVTAYNGLVDAVHVKLMCGRDGKCRKSSLMKQHEASVGVATNNIITLLPGNPGVAERIIDQATQQAEAYRSAPRTAAPDSGD